jgi:hypothetical protein
MRQKMPHRIGQNEWIIVQQRPTWSKQKQAITRM